MRAPSPRAIRPSGATIRGTANIPTRLLVDRSRHNDIRGDFGEPRPGYHLADIAGLSEDSHSMRRVPLFLVGVCRARRLPRSARQPSPHRDDGRPGARRKSRSSATSAASRPWGSPPCPTSAASSRSMLADGAAPRKRVRPDHRIDSRQRRPGTYRGVRARPVDGGEPTAPYRTYTMWYRPEHCLPSRLDRRRRDPDGDPITATTLRWTAVRSPGLGYGGRVEVALAESDTMANGPHARDGPWVERAGQSRTRSRDSMHDPASRAYGARSPTEAPASSKGVLNPACVGRRGGELLLYPRCVAAGNVSRIGLLRGNAGAGTGCVSSGSAIALEPRGAVRAAGGGNRRHGLRGSARHLRTGVDRFVMLYTAFGPSGPRIVAALSSDGLPLGAVGPDRFRERTAWRRRRQGRRVLPRTRALAVAACSRWRSITGR